MSELQTHTERRARRAHRCFACRLPISPGTIYLDGRALRGSRVETYRQHLDCAEMMDIFLNHAGEEDFCEGTLWDELEDYDAEDRMRLLGERLASVAQAMIDRRDST